MSEVNQPGSASAGACEPAEASAGGASDAVDAAAPKGSTAEEEDKQQKFHEQMLYPTPGVRNYGYSDDFMMFTFKVQPCKRQEKHARGSCPYAHPGDVAQRRHPDTYQALLCPEVRAKKVCPRANACQCSHSAFEFWLHPDRYRTSLCEKAERCSRPVCFFAHNEKELRPLPAGLKPALPPAPDASSIKQVGGCSRMQGGMAHPSGADFAGGLVAPGLMQPQQVMYMQGFQALHSIPGRPLMHQPPMAMVPAAAAGCSPHAGYRPLQHNMPPALNVAAMQQQAQYGAMMGAAQQYPVPQSPLLSPSGQVARGGGMLMSDSSAQQFSPSGSVGRGSVSSGSTNNMAGMWQQQQRGPPIQGHPGAASATPSAAGMPLPEPLLQQFSQLGMGAAGIQEQASYDGSAGDPALLPAQVQPYGQQAMMYSNAAAEQGWVTQPPLQMQHSGQQPAQYVAIPQQYPADGQQHSQQAALAAQQPQQAFGLSSPDAQQQAAAAAAAAALAQPWGAAGGVNVMMSPQAYMGVALESAGQASTSTAPQTAYDVAGGW